MEGGKRRKYEHTHNAGAASTVAAAATATANVVVVATITKSVILPLAAKIRNYINISSTSFPLGFSRPYEKQWQRINDVSIRAFEKHIAGFNSFIYSETRPINTET